MNRSLLLALSLLAATGCPSDPPTSAAAAPTQSAADVDAIPVVVAPARTGTVVRTLELGGLAEAWRAARLAPSAQGVVEVLSVQLGDTVRKGQLLAAIDTTALRLQKAAAERSVDLASIQLRDATAEANRARSLAPSGAITSRDLEKAELGLELATAQLAQARSQAAALDGQIGLARVVAPFAGRVTALTVEQGEFFASMSAMGGPPMLLEVQAMDVIRVDVAISEMDLSRVQEGMPVSLQSDSFPGRAFPGEVTLVNAAATPGARTFLVRIKVPNADGALRPGMFLRAHLVVDERSDVVSVAPEAVTRQDDGSYVMVVTDGIANRRAVEPGLRGDDGWEVGGVQPGEAVVVQGQFGLPEGARVRLVNAERG